MDITYQAVFVKLNVTLIIAFPAMKMLLNAQNVKVELNYIMVNVL